MKRAFFAIVTLLLLVGVFTHSASAAQGRLVGVVDGDTIHAGAVDGGPGTIEIRLRCSDAPTLSSPFGKEAHDHLQQLLAAAPVFDYTVIEYCNPSGAASSCIEALVYLPDPEQKDGVPESSYINAQMIAAGMAKNLGCRGVYAQAQSEAQNAKRGIWSTTQKIVYSEPSPTASTAVAPTTAKTPTTQDSATAPSATGDVFTYSLVDRTVTIRSKRAALSKVVELIDKVSTLPVNVYLKEEQHLVLNLEKMPWQTALQTIARAADLKQLNVNGKIELYTAAFYYENIAQHLKISGSDAVFLGGRSGDKPKPVADDGNTHYVYVNDFRNSAQTSTTNEEERGFIQAHDGGSQIPVNNDGVFEVHDDQQATAPAPAAPAVAATEPPPKPVAPPAPVQPPAPAPKVVEKAPTPPPVKTVKKPQPAPADKPKPTVAKKPAEKPEIASVPPATKPETAEPSKAARELPIGVTEAVAMAVILLVVVGGGFLLMRSAERSRREAEEKKVEIPDPWQTEEPEVEPVQAIDKEYEKEILEELEHVEDNPPQLQPKAAPAAPASAPKPIPVASAPPEPKPVKTAKAKKSNLAGVMVTEGNYKVTVDDYQKYMVPPNREPRQDCLFEVKCTINDEVLDGIGLDISRGGIFIDSKEEFEAGTELEFVFKLRDGDPQPVRGKGFIAWRNERPDPIKPNYPNGFGVQFAELEAGAAELVEAYMQTLEVEEAG